MATLLTKDVARETLKLLNRKGRKMIVTLIAGDMLEFRAKGSRVHYQVYLGHCMNMAVADFINEQDNKRQQEYKDGIRKRRPKRSPRVYATRYYTVMK